MRPVPRRPVVAVLLALALLLLATPFGHAALAPADLVITGTVRSSGGAPIHGAAVDAMGIFRASTDSAGAYRLVVPERLRGDTLVVRARAIGFAPQVKAIHLVHDSLTVEFSLTPDLLRMEGVVVTGSGTSNIRLRGSSLPFTVGGKVVGANVTKGAAASHERDRNLSGEEYARIVDNAFRSPRTAPRSTFGVDVDRASYSNVRRIIAVDAQQPPPDAVRIEEFVNYFPYSYPQPTGAHPFAVHTEVSRAPWAPEHLVVRIGLQARAIDAVSAPANNLVFLIDVSGSMSSDDKLPLLKQALPLLVEQLREQDRVAIVVYAGAAGLVLPSTSGAEKRRILDAISALASGGSTAGGAGIRLAYDIAKAYFIPNGNNRVILATDGDFNVGTTSNAELERLVEERRAEGSALTVLGFGAENIKDNRMEMLADKADGNYAYIDSPLEARKVLVQEMGGTLVTVAKDVKLQVEFNPAVVAGYRLLGYENRLLADEDFKDDRKDAGDIGAGHTVTALYEIIPVGAKDAPKVPAPDSLRYARSRPARTSTAELMFVKLRYKAPGGTASVPMEVAIANRVSGASTDFRFAQAVAAFGMVLRKSEHRGSASPTLVLDLARGALGADPGDHRAEFVKLVSSYVALSDKRVSENRR